MNPKANFFICSCVILAFAIVNLHIGPTVTFKIGNWSSQSCNRISDELNEMDNPTPEKVQKKTKRNNGMSKQKRNECNGIFFFYC